MLSHPVKPRNGLSLRTLGDAAFFIQSLAVSTKKRPVWDYAAAVITGAAMSGEKADIAEATRSLDAALRAESNQCDM